MFIAHGTVRITGAKLTERIQAPNARKAREIGQEWARENDLVFRGIEDEANPDPPRQELNAKAGS